MQADWEFEADNSAPAIDACWPGFVDLRLAPECAIELPEARQCPALAAALVRLNARDSAVWTSKCDYFPHIEPGEFDADELDAPAGDAEFAVGCYIDLLSTNDGQWALPARAAEACKHLCSLLLVVDPRCCRADLVIRRAELMSERLQLGITAYFTACGPTPAQAAATLAAALAAFAEIVSTARLPSGAV